jgi:recombinational DNA repair ATPase RecF
MDDLKIIGLKVDGIRKLTAIEMELKESGITAIKGENQQGKTSIIDTIRWLILGNKAINKSAINREKEKANAEIILGKYSIKRVLSNKTSKLEVRNIETNTVEKGEVQNFLDTLINELTFNPRPFLDMTSAQQLKFCLDLFGIDFTEIDKQLLTLEQDRLITGREIKRFGEIEPVNKVDSIDIDLLFSSKKEIENKNNLLRKQYEIEKEAEIKEIVAFNNEQKLKTNKFIESQNLLSTHKNLIEKQIDKIDALKEQLAQAGAELNRLNAYCKQIQHEINNLPDPEDEKEIKTSIKQPAYVSTEDIDNQISNALLTNKEADLYTTYLKRKKEKSKLEDEYDSFDLKVKQLRDKKLEILRNVNTGVQGLEIKEEGIYYNNVFSADWSDAEGLRISSELCIAQMPQLRAIFLDRGESLDKKSLQSLEEWAIKNDIQVIITMVANEIDKNSNDSVFYIEEGKIITKENSNG